MIWYDAGYVASKLSTPNTTTGTPHQWETGLNPVHSCSKLRAMVANKIFCYVPLGNFNIPVCFSQRAEEGGYIFLCFIFSGQKGFAGFFKKTLTRAVNGTAEVCMQSTVKNGSVIYYQPLIELLRQMKALCSLEFISRTIYLYSINQIAESGVPPTHLHWCSQSTWIFSLLCA